MTRPFAPHTPGDTPRGSAGAGRGDPPERPGGHEPPKAAAALAVERLEPGTDTAAEVLFCGGFHSSMRGNKARAIEAYCAARGHGCTRFDYRGHGESGGDVATLTLLDWLDDTLRVVDGVDPARPLLVVGSSMGAWLAVHAALRRRDRVAALVLVAAAPDFLGASLVARLDAGSRERLERGLVARLPTPEDPAGYPLTRALIDSGTTLSLLDTDAARELRCPVRMLHGLADEVAPWSRAAALLERVGSEDATLELVRGGDHRLSAPTDLERLARTLDELAASSLAPGRDDRRGREGANTDACAPADGSSGV